MKTRITIFLTLIATFFLFAEDMITWDRYYGGPYSDWVSTITQTSDGGYVFGGSRSYQYSEDWYVSHAQIYKIDSLGDSLWQIPYIYAGGPTAGFLSIIETFDGNIVALGSTEIASRVFGAFLLKLDQVGNVLWEKIYSHGETMSALSLTETTDHGLAICGNSDLNDSLKVGIVMKFDENGDSLWTTELRNDGYNPFYIRYTNKLYSIKGTTDNEMITCGYNVDRNGSDGWVVKLNNNGETIFSIDTGDSTVFDEFYGLDLYDNGFIAVGKKLVNSKGDTDIYVVKFNLSGDTLWSKSYGFEGDSWEDTYCVSSTNDNGCIITGQTRGDVDDLFLLRLDENGDSLWTKVYEPADRPVTSISASGLCVKQTTDNGYVVCGQGTNDSYNNSYDMWIIKLDEEGNFTGIMDNLQFTIDNYALEQNYPNPFNNMTTIEYGLDKISDVKISVFNSSGQKVSELVNNKMGKGNHSVLFDGSRFNSGVYYYQLEIDGNKVKNRKMIYLK